MSAAEILEQIRQLPPQEREEVVARVIEEFDDELSSAEIEIIDRRLKEHRDNPDDVIPWEDAKARLEAKFGE